MMFNYENKVSLLNKALVLPENMRKKLEYDVTNLQFSSK